MKPLFLFTMPRSGGEALRQMLDRSGAACAPESGDYLNKLREVIGDDPRAAEAARQLIAIKAPQGIRSSFSGRDSWEDAVGFYSWVLRTWTDARIIFLIREEDDDGRYELSLMGSAPLWIPAYGSCFGNTLKRTRDQRCWMEDFATMNPGRCLLLRNEDLGNFEGLSAALASIGLPAPDGNAWREVTEQRPGNLKAIGPAMEELRRKDKPGQVVIDDHGEDPFVDDPEMMEQLRKEDAKEEAANLIPKVLRLPLDPRPAAGNAEVHVLRYGESKWIRECAASLDAWAERHGLAVTVWDSPNPAYPSPKFCEVDMLRAFVAGNSDWLIYVDADVFVHPSAPAFPLVPGFSIMEDLPHIGKVHEGWETWCDRHFPGLDTAGWKYRNAGVWACDRESAVRMLEVIAEPYFLGVMEQHHFNVWLLQATAAGMTLNSLPEEWNEFASQKRAAWFHHLAGRGNKDKKLASLRALHLLPQRQEPFREAASTGPRAICYLWSSKHATWDELRHSLRSVRKHFVDCPPIHIFGDRRPDWLVEGHGATFHKAQAYEVALAAALQVADEIVLFNDDIYLLKPTRWEDFATALTRNGHLIRRMRDNLVCQSRWKRSVGRATASLHHHGHDHVRDFSTHTAYLFARSKSLETMRRHGIWWKVPFETLYHNDHGTPHRPSGPDKTGSLPCEGEPRFLNHGASGPSASTKGELKKLFRALAPWEKSARGPVTAAVLISPDHRGPHVDTFFQHNPATAFHFHIVERLHGKALHHAWRNADRALFEWWESTGRSLKCDRVLFMEWDVAFAAKVEDTFPAEGDFQVPEVKKATDAWDWWAEIDRLPKGLRDHAAGIAPQAVVMISRQCLEAITALPDFRAAMDADVFCELRLATLATAAGYPPVAVPQLAGVGINAIDPGDRPGVWHPVKEAKPVLT